MNRAKRRPSIIDLHQKSAQVGSLGLAVHLLTRDEARRIAVNIAKAAGDVPHTSRHVSGASD
jgi:hypothetical protein